MSADADSREGDITIAERAAGWAFAIALGPLMLGGEIVGPLGHVAWKQIAAGLFGTMLWVVVIVEVFGL